MSGTVEKKTPEVVYSPSQRKVIETRNKNLIVSASAGAGKTAVLVERLCQLVIQDHIGIDSILAMTFTEDAAREMKVRLKERLSRCDQNDPWISRQLGELETASISTIHSFCLDIVQHYYYLAGLSYSMVSTVDNGLADEQAMAKALQSASEQLDPARMAQLRLYMESFSQSEEDLRRLLLRFLETARSKTDGRAWMESCRHETAEMKEWFIAWYAMRIQALSDIFETMEEEVEQMSFAKLEKKEEYLQLFSKKIQALKRCAQALEARDYDLFGKEFIDYLEKTGKFTPTINKQNFSSIQKDSREYEKEIASVLFHPEDFVKTARRVQPAKDAFIDLAILVKDTFAKIKKQEEFIDFGDMEQFAWQILQNRQAADELRERYQVILVDEYQDTNDLQEAIIQAIARKDNVFRVGDIKQSIYGFRHARPSLMQNHIRSAGDLDEVIAMQENYRSTARLIRFNNEFFNELMNLSVLPSQFGPADEAKPGTSSQSEGEQPPVRFLFTEYEGWNPPDKEADEDRTSLQEAKKIHRKNRYDLIARDICRKIRAKEVSARDIAILSRSSTPHDELKEALEAWGIRAIHHMKKGFYTNKSVQIVLSALRVIADRRNDVALMAALCSPLTGYKQSDLLPLLENRDPAQSLYQTLSSTSRGWNMLKMVGDMRPWRKLPLPEIITRIYAYNDFYTASTTSQDKTNLDLLLSKAVDASRLMDLDEFLKAAYLEEDLDKTSEAIPFAREEDAVRISTIHASKGLQYKLVYILSEQTNPDMEARSPVRIDSDLGLSFNGLDSARQLKERSASDLAFSHKRFIEDLQEKIRLLYVACTRAQHELVFVDTLKSADMFDWDLDTRGLLNNDGFTSWFFHLRHRRPGLDVRFEEEDILERPEGKLYPNRRIRIPRYALGAQTIRSQTASRAKQSKSWPKSAAPGLALSVDARSRGTLMHELAAGLPFPYTKEEIEARLSKSRQKLDEKGIEQLLELNRQPEYVSWMKLDHQFECPYAANLDGAIVHGYMDLVVFDKNVIQILDFKSDRVMDAQSLIERYHGQLETYRNAMHQIRPEAEIFCWIYSFELGELIKVE